MDTTEENSRLAGEKLKYWIIPMAPSPSSMGTGALSAAFDKLACVDQGQIVDNKRLGTVLRLAQVKQDERESEGKRERSKNRPAVRLRCASGNSSGLSIPFWQTRACLWQVQSDRIDHQCCKVPEQ